MSRGQSQLILSTTTQVERMKDMFEVFDTKAAGLAPEQVEAITVAGAKAPYRNWGAKWPYFVSGTRGEADGRCKGREACKRVQRDRAIAYCCQIPGRI